MKFITKEERPRVVLADDAETAVLMLALSAQRPTPDIHAYMAYAHRIMAAHHYSHTVTTEAQTFLQQLEAVRIIQFVKEAR